jgi:hypothetical protein
MTRLMALVLGALAVSLIGCSTMQNTPQQEYRFALGRICEREVPGQTRIERVEPNGRYWVNGGIGISELERQRFFACMQEQFKVHPYLDWLKTRQASAQSTMVVPSVASTTGSAPLMPPVWHVGDQWEYAYQSPSGSGTFVWSVDREDVVEGVSYYVIKSDRTREIYFRKSDFAYSMDKVNGQIETRHVPPTPVVPSPLEAGAKWELRYTRERPIDRQTENMGRSCESSGPETVTVPAGAFETFKTTCRNARTGNVDYEVWYSTAVNQMVCERLPLAIGGTRVRELSAYKLK